jgi:hypothetical protein
MLNSGNVNKNFPYPVLGNINDFDGDNLFALTIRYGAQGSQYEFSCNLRYDAYRDDYENFIKEKKVKYVIQVFNTETFYRQYFEGFEKEIHFNIPQNLIRGTVLFTAFMVATEEIVGFSPIGQSEEFYGDEKFDFLPGSQLAISNTIKHTFDPNFNDQNESNAKHIITFVPDKNILTHFEVLEWGQHQLQVGIPKKLHEEFSKSADGDNKYFHHMAFYLPVLTEIIWRVESDDENNQFSDLKWYRVIEQLIEKEDLDKNLDPHVKAQKLMKGPLKPYIKRLDHLMKAYIEG